MFSTPTSFPVWPKHPPTKLVILLPSIVTFTGVPTTVPLGTYSA